MLNYSVYDHWAQETVPNGLQLYRFGSTTLPWIQQPHDIDYAVLLTASQYNSIMERPNFRELKPVRHIIMRTDWNIWGTIAYEFKYAVPIYDHVGELPQFDIYNPSIKKWILNDFVRFTRRNSKVWYHVYTNLAFWKNGNWQLTEEDIARINRFHDCCATEEDFDIMIQILNEEKLKTEVAYAYCNR